MSTESEWKRLLDADGWKQLRAWAKERGALLGERVQTNYYLDTPGMALASSRMLLRLREADGAWEMTFKRGMAEAAARRDGSQVSEEVESAIDTSDAQRWLADPCSLLEAKGELPAMGALRRHAGRLPGPLDSLVLSGVMATHRTRIKSPTGTLVLELDHSRYGDDAVPPEDYELECEGEDLAVVAAEVTALLAELGIDHRPSTQPKQARMLAAQGR